MESLLKKLMYYMRGFIRNRIFVLSLFKNVFLITYNKIKYQNIVWIHLQEHIGDIVACEPISVYAHNTYPNAKIFWFTKAQYKSLIMCNPNIDSILSISCILEWILLKKMIQKDKIIDLHFHKRKDLFFPIMLNNPNKESITLDNYYNYGSILETFSLAGGIPRLDAQPVFHLCKNIKKVSVENYIVLHCASNETSRNWQQSKWLQLVEQLTVNNYVIVEIGLEDMIQTINIRYFNYCGRKDLQDIANIISKAEIFIGVDSGFAHIANAMKIPSVILLGHYRIFSKYMPYTGFFAENSDDMIIQYDGLAAEIPVDMVITKVRKLLQCKKVK